MAFNATVGDPSANSYLTVARAEELLPALVSPARAAAWAALESDTLREGFLMRACSMLERYFDWEGSRTLDYVQKLAWPRDFVVGPDRCTYFAADAIPERIEEAQTLMAICLMEGFDQDDSASAPLNFMKISSLAFRFDTAKAARSTTLVPFEVIELLRGYGEYIGASGMARSITMERG